MFSNILVPTDWFAAGPVICRKGRCLCSRCKRDDHLCRCFSTDNDQILIMREEYRRLAETQAAQFLTEAEIRARQEGVVCHTKKVEGDDIASAKTATTNAAI